MRRAAARSLRIWGCGVLLFLLPYCALGQVFSYSQPDQLPLLLNPAYTGASDFARLNIALRSQWLSIKSPYNTYGASYDMNFGAYGNHAGGISVVNDVQGAHVLQHTEMFLYYAYMWDVTFDLRLRIGLQAGAIMKSTNYSKVVLPDMLGEENPPSTGYHNSTRVAPDFAVGFAGDIDDWHFGAAVHHIVEPAYDVRRTNYLKTERKVTLHGSKRFNIFGMHRFREPLYLTPHLVLMQQGRNFQVAAGGSIDYKGVLASIWLRETILHESHNIGASVGWSGDRFAISYAYNMGFMPQGFMGLNASTHEVALTVKFHPPRGSHIRSPFGKKSYRKSGYKRYSRKRSVARYRRRRR